MYVYVFIKKRVHMQRSSEASWSWKGPQEIIGIQIFSFPIQFSQFKNN